MGSDCSKAEKQLTRTAIDVLANLRVKACGFATEG